MRLRQKFAQIWFVVLLGGVGGASLIPPGYMPGLNATGELALVLCSGEVIKASDDSDGVAPSVCWFTATQASALHCVPILVSISPSGVLDATQHPAAPRSRIVSAHLARGPPLHS